MVDESMLSDPQARREFANLVWRSLNTLNSFETIPPVGLHSPGRGFPLRIATSLSEITTFYANTYDS